METPDSSSVIVAVACIGVPVSAVLLAARRWRCARLVGQGAFAGGAAVGVVVLVWLVFPSDTTQAILWDIVPGTAAITLVLACATLFMSLRRGRADDGPRGGETAAPDSQRHWRAFAAVCALSSVMQVALWLAFLVWLIATWAKDMQ